MRYKTTATRKKIEMLIDYIGRLEPKDKAAIKDYNNWRMAKNTARDLLKRIDAQERQAD